MLLVAHQYQIGLASADDRLCNLGKTIYSACETSLHSYLSLLVTCNYQTRIRGINCDFLFIAAMVFAERSRSILVLS